MQPNPQDTAAPSIEERQLRAMLQAIDPVRAALLDISTSDEALDDEAVRACVDALREHGRARDGSRAGRALGGVADALERRWFT